MNKKTILVVGLERDSKEKIIKKLAIEGYRAMHATSIIILRHTIKCSRPDLILYQSDEKTLKSDLYKEIKSNPSTASLPIIFAVPNPQTIEDISLIDYEAEDFLELPIDENLLAARIKAFFNKTSKIELFYEQKMEKLRGNISFALPHEFRTPLNSILGFSEMIFKTIDTRSILYERDIDDVKEMALHIQDAGKRLNRLTENFLLYAQIQIMEGKQEKIDELRSQSLHNAKEVIFDVATSLFERVDRLTDLTLSVQDVCVQMSPLYFYKLIYELVDNAIKFSSEGDIVHIMSRRVGTLYEIIIKDNGIGMTPDQISCIGAYGQFDRYVNEQQGAGLGLIIAKLLVILHGGSFAIESQTGNGTTVKFALPIVEKFHYMELINSHVDTSLNLESIQ